MSHIHNDRMTNFVKGYVEPELNDGQRSLLELFINHENESEDWRQPTRIDKVEIESEDSILIYTSQFIELEPSAMGTKPHKHLQIMAIRRYYQPDDPYDDSVLVWYREVMLTNVYRTFIDDRGWVSLIRDEYDPDISDLHTDWL